MARLSLEEELKLVSDSVAVIETEEVALKDAAYRIIAQDVVAKEDVPPFDRTPYDGYALRSEDVKTASQEEPVVLKVLEEIPAGGVSHYPVTEGTAVRVMTGAPIPPGADCIIMYERTEFTDSEVKIFNTLKHNENIVFAGEDTKKGTVLAKAGQVIDAGLLGTLAGQGIARPLVYKVPKVGIITTGSELLEVEEELVEGKIHDSNGYTLNATVKKLGCEPVMYGIVGDDIDNIAEIMTKALNECDAVLTTGGVSVGDFDYTPAAMEKAGIKALFHGAPLKPGMACTYGVKDGKLVCALSGNPNSSLINFLVLGRPAILKLSGSNKWNDDYITVTLKGGFKKGSKGTRLIHGKLDLSDGTVKMDLAADQGNVIISSTIGSDVLAIIPAGSGPLEPGAQLKAFKI